MLRAPNWKKTPDGVHTWYLKYLSIIITLCIFPNSILDNWYSIVELEFETCFLASNILNHSFSCFNFFSPLLEVNNAPEKAIKLKNKASF